MVAAGKIGEFVKQGLKPGGILAVEQLARGTAGRTEQGPAHLVLAHRDGIEGHPAKAILPDQLLKGGELKAIGLHPGQADSLGEDLLDDVLPGIRPLPPAPEDVEDVDVRLFIQAAGGDYCKIGAGLRAGGQVDEGAGLERGALDDGQLREVLNHGSWRPIRPGYPAGWPDGYGMRGVGWRGGCSVAFLGVLLWW